MKQWHLILLSVAAGAAGAFAYNRFFKKPCPCKDKFTVPGKIITGANMQNDADVKLNYTGVLVKKA